MLTIVYSALSPTLDWWIKDIKLADLDRKGLTAGELDRVYSENLLAHQFPHVEGFQHCGCIFDVGKSRNLVFKFCTMVRHLHVQDKNVYQY